MNVIITMAGKGTRAKNLFHTKKNKYAIEVHGKSMLERSLNGLKELFCQHFIFIVRSEFEERSLLVEVTTKLGIKHWDIAFVEGDTNGQATSALAAKPKLDSMDSIIIYNIDTEIVDFLDFPKNFAENDGWLLVTQVEGTRWSFVKSKNGLMTDVAEKRRISNQASVGMYGFKSFDVFEQLYLNHVDAVIREYGESYISPLYKFLLKSGLVAISNIPRKQVKFLDYEKDIS
ncbi:hypothetical protein WFA24289_01860 [Periweissella fabaria]|uniref:MobA-like NTP transferase domain-containing protein n=1 Tax=Periweissella fabaria TaxID=546157 RepID=A0ABM8Z7X8_9LACO|nr:hypothetical protein [Periweissella fabaria]CAH0417518.1 hypothetical protein WFA24289_01860 [Periweissella fabaria]